MQKCYAKGILNEKGVYCLLVHGHLNDITKQDNDYQNSQKFKKKNSFDQNHLATFFYHLSATWNIHI
jgi:hypothetical protein